MIDNHGDMNSYEDLIAELAGLCGIVPEYYDIYGNKHIISPETRKAVLKAMNLRTGSFDEVRDEVEERRVAEWRNFVAPVKVISVNEQPMTFQVFIPLEESDEEGLQMSLRVHDEDGHSDEYPFSWTDIVVAGHNVIDGTRYAELILEDRAFRNIGYYTADVEYSRAGGPCEEKRCRHKTVKVIVTPDHCYTPPELQERRIWGMSVELYSIRSERNWGAGDFTDLEELVEWMLPLGAGFVGINPLHAIKNTMSGGASPYYPVSRLYRNYLYLDVEKIPDVRRSGDCRKIMKSGTFREKLGKLRREGIIDYDQISSMKADMLRRAFRVFYDEHYLKDTRRGRDFKEYIEREGDALESFALFSAISDRMEKDIGANSWQEWPEDYRRPSSAAVQKFRNRNRKKVLFYQYVQWLIDGQLRSAYDRAKKLGMPIGTYHDLAVGCMGGGSDAWVYQDIIADNMDVGAPPDDFSPDGQNWGFPPMIPEKLKEAGYDLFIRTIRKSMEHGGALRIDHALGLFRLFWIPRGMPAGEGAYIDFPSEDLLRIIALESMRNRTLVIAEDLGTVGENVRESLRRFRMFSYRLFYFERNYPDASFAPPENYPDMALCAVTTHDLPTLYGYWIHRDLEARRQHGGLPDDDVWRKGIEERERDKRFVVDALKSRGLLPEGYPDEMEKIPEMSHELCMSVYKYLALSPCRLVLVRIDDIIGTLDQQNLPGRSGGYPNWMQKTPLSLEQIVKDKRFVDLSEMLNKNM
jgi:4-alpha-glucanotransferase